MLSGRPSNLHCHIVAGLLDELHTHLIPTSAGLEHRAKKQVNKFTAGRCKLYGTARAPVNLSLDPDNPVKLFVK